MDSRLSYMELLAAVGEKAPIQESRIQSSPSPERRLSPQFDPVVEVGSSSRNPSRLDTPCDDTSENELSGDSDGKECEFEWSDTEEDDVVGLCSADESIPTDDGVLYDYEFPITDSERVDVEIPVVNSINVDPHGEQQPWKKRKRHTKGVFLPHCRKSNGMGAVETAMRRSSTRTTTHIFEPAVGMTFDSVAEAHNFFNLYSWEKGFGIRYGKSHTNKVNTYRSMQEIECGSAGRDRRVENNSRRCGCKAMIRLHRTEDHGWFISRYDDVHNHPMSTSCGEKMQWPSHRNIDEHTRDMIKCLRENNISLTKVHGVLGSFFGSVKELPFTKRSIRTVCSQLAKEQLDDDVKKTLRMFRQMRTEDPDFAFSVEPDEQNRIKSLIWTNQRSKMQYSIVNWPGMCVDFANSLAVMKPLWTH